MQLLNSTSKSKQNEKHAHNTLLPATPQSSPVSITLSGVSDTFGRESLTGPHSISYVPNTTTKHGELATFSNIFSDHPDAAFGTFFAPALSGVTAGTFQDRKIGLETRRRLFEIRVDVGLVQGAERRIAEMVSLILKGAGFRQNSQSLWTGTGCDIEEAADSLSDVFLELQELDTEVKKSFQHIHMTMYEQRRSNE